MGVGRVVGGKMVRVEWVGLVGVGRAGAVRGGQV